MGQEDSSGSGVEYQKYLSKVTKEAGFAFFARVFGLLFGFVAQAIIAKLLGADLLGVFVIGLTVVRAVAVVSTFGFEGSLVRYVSMYISQGRTAKARSVFILSMRIAIVLAVVGTLLIIVFRRPLAITFFKDERLVRVLLWISLALLPQTLMKLFSAGLRALKDVKRDIIGIDLSFRVTRLAAFLILYWAGLSLFGIVGASIVASFASMTVLLSFLSRRGRFLFTRAIADDAAIDRREYILYSGAMLADIAMAFGMQHSDRLILGFFLESADVGVYNIAALIAGLAIFVLLSFNAIFSPVISDVYHRGRTDLQLSLFHSTTRWIILLTVPIYAWIVAVGDVTLAVFGEEFARGYLALTILAGGMTIGACTGPVGVSLAMTGYQRYNVYNTFAMALLAIGLDIVLIPRMGIVGCAIATGTAVALVNIVRLLEVKLLLGMLPYGKATVKVLPTVLVLLALTYVVRTFVTIPDGWFFSLVVAAAMYGVMALLTILMGISDEDRFVLSSIAAKIRRRRGRS